MVKWIMSWFPYAKVRELEQEVQDLHRDLECWHSTYTNTNQELRTKNDELKDTVSRLTELQSTSALELKTIWGRIGRLLEEENG